MEGGLRIEWTFTSRLVLTLFIPPPHQVTANGSGNYPWFQGVSASSRPCHPSIHPVHPSAFSKVSTTNNFIYEILQTTTGASRCSLFSSCVDKGGFYLALNLALWLALHNAGGSSNDTEVHHPDSVMLCVLSTTKRVLGAINNLDKWLC